MPMIMTPAQAEWFHRMRQEWLEKMSPFRGFGPSDLFPPLPLLPAERFTGCTLLPQREDILKRLPQGSIGAELGTQEGWFARRMLDFVNPKELHLFDIDLKPLYAKGDADLIARVQLHEGDSSTLLAQFPHDYFDWIYIDGDHSYEGVSRDIAVARTRVKPGGLLIFNDFTLWSPLECIDYGVPHAVCELVANEGWNFIYFALNPWLYNDVALERPHSLKKDVPL